MKTLHSNVRKVRLHLELLFPECLPEGLLFPAGFAPVIALETSTFEMLSIPNGSQTATSQVLQYNMTNSTDSPYTTPPNIPLSTTSPNTTGNSTTPTMVETGKRYFLINCLISCTYDFFFFFYSSVSLL